MKAIKKMGAEITSIFQEYFAFKTTFCKIT